MWYNPFGVVARHDSLFIDTMLVATIEAKAEHLNIPSVIDYQCKDCQACDYGLVDSEDRMYEYINE